jgi:Second Messenger Oligonucleotide or Dinucleotide Synthetase domain
MISVAEAFDKFKGRLEPGEREESDAVSRRERVKEVLENAFHLERVIITGSYRRWTKIKPLKDVDPFCILNSEKEGDYLKNSSRVLLDAFGSELKKEYGDGNVQVWAKCVTVKFGEPEEGDEDRVFSVDVVPAFEQGKAYNIPDAYHPTGWMRSDPEVHAELATKANKVMDGKWVTLVKMVKKCNANHEKPVDPSFLIEVMALKLIVPPFSGGYKYEIKSLIASIEQQIGETWPDPAGLGPAVSDQMTPSKIDTARTTLKKIRTSIDRAMLYERQGRIGDALSTWRNEVFGPMFPLS